jgi:hypothetical protein
MRGFLLGAIALLGLVSAASAADIPAYGPLYKTAPVANFGWETEFGGRYWYSNGKTQWDLFGIPPAVQVSRLTFSGLTGHAGELYGRLDHSSGLFVKGYAGFGALIGGKLQDEDWPPFTPIYSSTDSDQRVGHLGYLTADLGWAFWTTPFVRVGAFVGYHYYSEKVNVYGCNQTVGGEICVPTIPTSVLLITQESNWNAARVGYQRGVENYRATQAHW